METEAKYDRMDRVQFDRTMEFIESGLANCQFEVNKTKKNMLTGGYFKFDTCRLINDMKKLIDFLNLMAPQGFIETAPLNQDAVQPDTSEPVPGKTEGGF